MPLSYSRKAYEDCFDLFARAMDAKRGIQVKRSTYEEAYYLRNRLNKARTLERSLNRRIYAEQTDHPLYDNSENYQFSILIEADEDKNCWWVLIKKNKVPEQEIMEIPDEEGEAPLVAEEIPSTEEVEDEFGLAEGDMGQSEGGTPGASDLGRGSGDDPERAGTVERRRW